MTDSAEARSRDTSSASTAPPPSCAPAAQRPRSSTQHASRWKTGLVVSACVHVGTFFALGAWASNLLQPPETPGFRNAHALRESLGAPQGFSLQQDLLLPLEPVLVDVPPVGTAPLEAPAGAVPLQRHVGLESSKIELPVEVPAAAPAIAAPATQAPRADEEPLPTVESVISAAEPAREVAQPRQPTERSALLPDAAPGDLPPLDTPMHVTPRSATVGKRHFVLESTKVELPEVARPAVDSLSSANAALSPAPREPAEPAPAAIGPQHPTRRAALPLGPARAGLYAPSAAVGQSASVGTTDTAAPEGFRNFPPIYPEAAARDRLEGTVMLRILVKPDGSVGDLEVFHSSGHAVLDGAAVQAVKDWRYRPARRGNQPVEFVMRVEIIFTLRQ